MERTRVTMVMVCLVVLIMTFVTGQTKAPCPSLKEVSKQLWDKDTSQRLTKNDIQVNVPPIKDRLFQNVNPAKITSQTFKTFQALLKIYHPDIWDKTKFTDKEVQANNEFLDAILNTNVMKRLLEHLICEEKATSSSDLKNKLTTAWFVIYPPNTSEFGFRHVMEGLYDGKKSYKGLHNWLSLYLKENNEEINNYRDVTIPKRGVIRANFNWNGRSKDEGSSFFLGVSPEFDMAIYSLCYFMKPDKVCPISVNGRDMNIKTYVTHGHIETAYVTFN